MASVPPLVGMAEAADILGFSKSNFNQHRKRYDRPGEDGSDSAFPQPVQVLRCGPIWRAADMEKWAKTFNKVRRPAPSADAKKAPAKKVAASKKTAPAKPVVAKKAAVVKKAVAPVKKSLIGKKAA